MVKTPSRDGIVLTWTRKVEKYRFGEYSTFDILKPGQIMAKHYQSRLLAEKNLLFPLSSTTLTFTRAGGRTSPLPCPLEKVVK